MPYQSAYKPGSGVARPAAQTWQEQQEVDAQNMWNDQRQSLEGDRTRSRAASDEMRGRATAAADRFSAGRPTNVAGYSASNTAMYQPTQLGQWLSALSMPSGGGARREVRGTMTMPGAAGGGSGGGELSRFSADELKNFDPSAAGKEFAGGAYSEFKMGLGDELETLENRSVGAGRLRTGLFDRDQGGVVNRATDQFNSKIAQQAGTFSGQRLSALSGGLDLAYRRAADMDTNSRLASERQAADARAAEDAEIARYQAESQRYGMGLDAAGAADRLAFERAQGLDRYGFDQATYLDDQMFERDRTGLDGAMSRERTYLDDYNRSQDRFGDYTSATRDWASSDREAQDLRDEIRRLREEQAAARAQQSRTGGSGQAGSYSAQHPNAAVAKAAGVPYYG